MNADPQQIRAQVDAVLADLTGVVPEGPADVDTVDVDTVDVDTADIDTADIDAMGSRLEEAHQILVDALESVEKG